MRTLEAIEKDLGEAKTALGRVEGRTAEVYSRIVGYYRSVRNWNKGKREEFGERKLFDAEQSLNAGAVSDAGAEVCESCGVPSLVPHAARDGGLFQTDRTESSADGSEKLVLFVQDGCPSCPGAKTEAGKLEDDFGVDLEMVDAGTEEGIVAARKFGVVSTPTAILFSKKGEELSRARERDGIAQMSRFLKTA
jgi:ribonucleoside-triphosphate reductase